MPKNQNKETWTEAHDRFCLQNKIPPAAKLLWQWLLRQGLEQEIEPDLSEFQKWVEKHRGRKYAHNYLKQMFELLVDNRVLQVVKQYSWKIFKLVMRPLEWLKPRKEKRLHDNELTYKTHPSNPSKSVDEDFNNNLTLNKNELANEGIVFGDYEKEVLSKPTWQIRAAILLFKMQGGKEKIANPEGWIRQCLRRQYWELPTNYSAICRHFGGAVLRIEDYFGGGKA